jgi:hypothetical protein
MKNSSGEKWVVVFGGYGTFGSHVARELARCGVRVSVAGRSGRRAEAFARTLGDGHRFLEADLGQRRTYAAALDSSAVALNCAGPFADLGAGLLESCIEHGCHYVDLAEDRAYVAKVRALGGDFFDRNLVAAFGCSSLPGISGALALAAVRGASARVERARVTLFIGTGNPRGPAATASALRIAGKEIKAPQGVLKGFRDGADVRLGPPYGQRTVYNFESPEYDLFGELFGLSAVEVKVGFESRVVTRVFATLALLPGPLRKVAVRLSGRLRGLGFGGGGTGGAVLTELFLADGTLRRGALWGARDGQRMAALPAALVVRGLLEGRVKVRGAVTAYEALGAERLLEAIRREGFLISIEGSDSTGGDPLRAPRAH